MSAWRELAGAKIQTFFEREHYYAEIFASLRIIWVKRQSRILQVFRHLRKMSVDNIRPFQPLVRVHARESIPENYLHYLHLITLLLTFIKIYLALKLKSLTFVEIFLAPNRRLLTFVRFNLAPLLKYEVSYFK